MRAPTSQMSIEFPDGGVPGRDLGMQIAVEHADEESPGWSDAAYAALTSFARVRETFITPELREYARKLGVPEPATNWAWGSVLVRGARSRVIARCGTTQYGQGRDHKKERPVWRSLVL